MHGIDLLKGCELHLHILGAYHADDLLALGKDCYKDINWNEFNFIDSYQRIYGQHPEPIARFDDALTNGAAGFERFRRAYVFGDADGGDFDRWGAKNCFFLCIWSHWRELEQDEALLAPMLARHRAEGLDYVEYRCGSGMDGFLYWHSLCARVLQEASSEGFTARYILSIPRSAPMDAYRLTQQLFDQHPELIPTIVGVDFAVHEEGCPPKHMRPFCEQVHHDNVRVPDRALDIVYHVGESYFDKSLESAIRWCHEVANMGATRLGHAIALGLDPAVAIARRPQAHEQERVSERLDQIAYDLRYATLLTESGIEIDEPTLRTEQHELENMAPDQYVERPYDDQRLDAVRKRQQFVLNRLVELGTVIECCPTSNLRIGGVPTAADHPIHQFLRSNVNLVICSDDPGNLDSTLAEEVDWVLTHTTLSEEALRTRLGDPRRFRLGQRRPSPAS